MSAVEIQEVFDTLGIQANIQSPFLVGSMSQPAPQFEIVFSTESNPFGK